jgi:hypothetical protein
MTRSCFRVFLGLASGLLGTCASCDGTSGLPPLFGSSVRVIIENNTSFEAVPDINTSDSHNFLEDIFSEGEDVTDFGDHGTVAADRTVTFYITCDEDLEHIAIGEIEFREDDDDSAGTANARASFRRDTDFDCGDTIRLTLSGHRDDFSAEANVE